MPFAAHRAPVRAELCVSRRGLCAWSLACAATSALAPPACKAKTPPTREAVLAALVREIVVPDTRAVVTLSERLKAAVHELVSEPTLERWHAARGAWKRAILAWKRVQALRAGPILETSALVRAVFWPARLLAIEEALEAGTAIDEAFVTELGADVKGMFALEYLLFPLGLEHAAEVDRFRGAPGTRRRELAFELARSVASYASRAGAALGDGASFARRFAGGGGESLSVLMTELIASIEQLAVARLDLVIGLDKNRMLVPSSIEGGPSGVSHELAVAQFLAIDRLYRGGSGGGIAELVAAAAPALSIRVDERFDAARAAMRALNEPLERLVKHDRPRLVLAVAALKKLEITCKLEVASALGLTLVFPGGDGD